MRELNENEVYVGWKRDYTETYFLGLFYSFASVEKAVKEAIDKEDDKLNGTYASENNLVFDLGTGGLGFEIEIKKINP